ncbi:MAG: hypothetical protein OS130_06830 [Thermodesulfobacteriota bacterium]|nr:MAG: hypothetical protein OS130_06830 [Thermodesulfobacteriota bacterium]
MKRFSIMLASIVIVLGVLVSPANCAVIYATLDTYVDSFNPNWTLGGSQQTMAVGQQNPITTPPLLDTEYTEVSSSLI